MDFGLFTYWGTVSGETEAQAFAANFKEVDEVEAMGWDCVWHAEIHLLHDLCIDPACFVLASALATRTKRIKIGTAIHLTGLKAPGEELPESVQGVHRWMFDLLPSADPVQTAEQVAMVDHISEGRLIYGVGGRTLGSAARRAQLFEFIDVMKAIWSTDRFEGFHGNHYRYPTLPEGAHITPKPVQKPHPPILMAVDSQESFAAMGRQGYRIAIGGGSSHNDRGDDVLKEDVRRYREAWRAAGHPGDPSVVVRIPTHIAATSQRARSDAKRILRTAWERQSRPVLSETIPGMPSPKRTEEANIFCTPTEAIDRIYEIKERFSADEIMFELNYMMALPRDRVLNSMRLLTERVIPNFK